MSHRLVCSRCPECGYDGFEKVPPKGLAFGKDRQCDRCGCTYTPVANRGLAIVMVAIGGVAVAAVAVLIVIVAMRQMATSSNQAVVGPCAWVLPAAFGVIGGMLLYGGLKAMFQKPVDPPAYRERAPRLPGSRGG